MPDPFDDLPRRHFRALYADPPWAFRTWSGTHGTPHRTANDHYETLSLDNLCALPVESLAAPDAVLFLWVVDSHVKEGIRLGEAWGFQLKTIGFVWDKGRISMGYWTRKEGEVCFLFTRGKPRRLAKDVRQFIREPRREHSRKPDDTRARIERLVSGPYLELFARTEWPGWSTWGDDVQRYTGARLPVFSPDVEALL